jgi:signal transduction histidine kinase
VTEPAAPATPTVPAMPVTPRTSHGALTVDYREHSVGSSRRTRSSYWQRWRELPRELGFVLLLLPVIIVSCVLMWAGLALGIGLMILWVGVPILTGTLLVGRSLGAFELRRLVSAGRPPIQAPDWSTRRVDGSLWKRWLNTLADARTWSYWIHASVTNLLLGTVTWTIGVLWTGIALGGPTYWFWGQYLPHSDGELWLHTVVLQLLPGYSPATTPSGLFAGESVFYGLLGLLCLASLPSVIHVLVLAHHRVAQLMLSESATMILREEITASEASRVSAVLAEDSTLRRLERDLHDGPQQSLLRIQYDLASSMRALSPEDNTLRPLLENSLSLAKSTLQELRDLSRGLAPPLLQDRGLVPALQSLAARSTVPTTTDFEVDDAHPTATEIERSIYFVVSELIANITKHSGATAASISMKALTATTTPSVLIEVGDNGHGGATLTPGHGLEGIEERVSGLRGTLVISSPAGGPTLVSIILPGPK